MMKKTMGLAMMVVFSATWAHAQWPQWRGPGRSGVAGEDQTLTIGQWGPKGPKLAWQSEEIPSGDKGNWSSPVVAAGRAYVFVAWETDVPLPTRTIARKDVPRLKQAPTSMPAEQLAKVEAVQDKAMRPEEFDAWLAGTGFDARTRTAVEKLVPKSQAYTKDVLMCLEASTGKTLWKKEFALSAGGGRGASGTPCVADGKVYFTGWKGTVYCLNAASGEEVWNSPGSPTHSSLLLADGKLLTLMGGLVAYDAATGRRLWEKKGVGGGNGSPAIWRGGGKAYAIINGKQAACVDLADGKVMWQVPGGGDATPAIAGDVLAILTPEKGEPGGLRLYRISPEAAQPIASVALSSRGATPIAAGDRFYMLAEGTIACVNAADGKIAWQAKLGSESWASPILCGDKIVATVGKTVQVLTLGTTPATVTAKGPIDITVCTSGALDGSRLLVRGSKALLCYDLAQ